MQKLCIAAFKVSKNLFGIMLEYNSVHLPCLFKICTSVQLIENQQQAMDFHESGQVEAWPTEPVAMGLHTTGIFDMNVI